MLKTLRLGSEDDKAWHTLFPKLIYLPHQDKALQSSLSFEQASLNLDSQILMNKYYVNKMMRDQEFPYQA